MNALDQIHSARCATYLKATGLLLCLLLNFDNTHLVIGRFANGLGLRMVDRRSSFICGFILAARTGRQYANQKTRRG